MSLEGAIETHALIILDDIKDTLGDKWNEIPSKHRAAAERSARRIVELEWQKRTGSIDVDSDLEFVKTTVAGFKLAGEIALYNAFWEGVNKGLEALGSFLVGAGKSLLPGLGAIVAGIDIGEIINGS